MTSDSITEQAARIFRDAWHRADDQGQIGGRVDAGIRALADAGLLAHQAPAIEDEAAGVVTERRVPVQGGDLIEGRRWPRGTVAWTEHVEAWEAYHRRYPEQDAERIAQRGGFSYHELIEFLGHAPTTWQAVSR